MVNGEGGTKEAFRDVEKAVQVVYIVGRKNNTRAIVARFKPSTAQSEPTI